MHFAAVVDVALANGAPELVRMLPYAVNVVVFARRHEFNRAKPAAISLLHGGVHVHVLGHAEAQGAFDLPLESHAHALVLLVVLVDADEVSDLHDALFGALEAVAAAWRDYEHDEVDTRVN